MSEQKKVIKVKSINETPTQEATEVTKDNATQPFYKKWWFWLGLVCVVAVVVALAIINQKPEEKEPEQIVYLTEDQIDQAFLDPEAFSGYYIKIPGKMILAPEQNGDTYMIRAARNVQTFDGMYYIETSNVPAGLHENDVISVDGKIGGYVTETNSVGNEMKVLLITDAKVTKSSYVDAVSPTQKELVCDLRREEKGFAITVEKVQFANDETRVFLKVNNNTTETMQFYELGATIVQNGQQFSVNNDQTSIYEGGLEGLPQEYLPGTQTSGVIIFPALDSNKDFQLTIPDIMPDVEYLTEGDYHFQDMMFTIVPETESTNNTAATTQSVQSTTTGVRDVEIAEGNDGNWYAMKDGKIVVDYTGMVRNQFGNWYVEKGKVDFNFTGYITLDGTKYQIKDGKVVGQESA